MNRTLRVWIAKAMKRHGESFEDAVATAPPELEGWLDAEYRGEPFTVWTARRVYFPCDYDGAYRVESVSRDPDGAATEPMG
jgi:hypothetical protein